MADRLAATVRKVSEGGRVDAEEAALLAAFRSPQGAPKPTVVKVAA